MENASKALIMGSSILIAIIVISLLVAFFANLSNLKQIEEDNDRISKEVDFNKQYDAYLRDLYGSELLSLANKIHDYNQKEADEKGYQEIKLIFTVKKDIETDYFKRGTYLVEGKDINEIEREIGYLNTAIKKAGDDTVTKNGTEVKVSTMTGYRDNELEKSFGINYDGIAKIRNYENLKSILTKIKGMKYKFDYFKSDKNTGRITEIYYKYE